MAKSLLSYKKKTKVRNTRSETYLINKKYYGDEPTFTKPLNNLEFGKALNWYNCMCTNSEAREYLEDYLGVQGRSSEIKKLRQIADNLLPATAAWTARLLSRGAVLPDKPHRFIDTKLDLAYKKVGEPVTDEEKQVKSTVQDRVREKTSEIIGDIEALIDVGSPFSLYEWLQKNEVPASYCSSIVAYYTPWLSELTEAHDDKDPQLKEAYSHMTKRKLSERIKFIDSIIDDAEKYAGVTKKTRAPRKPRPVSIEKKLKGLKYQKESTEYKVASINPEKLIGAQELWTFNTKYNTVSVFRAIDRGGLQVKGTTLIGYDEKTSMTRGTGRQTESIVKQVLTIGKVALRKLLDEVKTVKVLQNRINENTILLRVVT